MNSGQMRTNQINRNPVYVTPDPALAILADHFGVKTAEARRALRKLARAGWFIAPMDPTNSMLSAYIQAYGTPTKRFGSLISHIGKARARWRAMGTAGMKIAMSLKRVKEEDEVEVAVL